MIAVIAGTGTLPLEACKNLMIQGVAFFVIALFPENNLQELKTLTAGKVHIIAQDCFKPSQILKLLKAQKTTKVFFIGKVDKKHLLSHIKLDWLAIKLLASTVYKSDASIMKVILAELARHGIEVIKQDTVLKSLLVQPGVLTGTLTPELEANITMGIKTAMMLSLSDIGQTIVIKDTMILAVEAIEGTDACIKRGIDLGKTGVIVCKAAQLGQNKKFDLPTLGPASLENLEPGQVAAIAWLSTHTLIAQQEAFIKKAKELGITLISVAPPLHGVITGLTGDPGKTHVLNHK